MISEKQLKSIVLTTAEKVISHEAELNTLDQAIGDGDHGFNMSRGCQALLSKADEPGYGSLSGVFLFVGRTLVSSIGGASGALYGSLFIHIGKNLDDNPSYMDFIDAYSAGVDAIKSLGQSDVEQKTLLDVIIPTLEMLRNKDDVDYSQISEYALRYSQLTIDMCAKKGRASFLGQRSVGHLDPGARSSQLIISSICQELKSYE